MSDLDDRLNELAARPGFARKVLDEGHPDAFWDRDRGLWMENDAALRARIKTQLQQKENE